MKELSEEVDQKTNMKDISGGKFDGKEAFVELFSDKEIHGHKVVNKEVVIVLPPISVEKEG